MLLNDFAKTVTVFFSPQTLLQRERSKDSETTSGCETGTSVDSSLQRQHSGSYSGGEADQETQEAASEVREPEPPSVPNYVGYSKVVSAATNGLGGHLNTSDSNSVSKPPPGYIQLPAVPANAAPPPSSGYIQIQKVPHMLSNGNPQNPELVPSTENPFYSRVSLPEPISDLEQGVKTTPGYIQLPPASSSLIISPNKLSEASPDSRPFEPHNTIV